MTPGPEGKLFSCLRSMVFLSEGCGPLAEDRGLLARGQLFLAEGQWFSC